MKKSLLTFVCIFSLCSASLFAQVNFQKYFSYQGRPAYIADVKTASAGGSILGANDSLSYSGILIKVNGTGAVEWAKSLTLGFTDSYFPIHNVAEVNGAGYLVLGSIVSNQYPDTSKLFLMKTDYSGNQLWVKYYQNHLSDSMSFPYDNSKITFLDNNDILITASFYESVYLIKTDSDGDLQWSKSYEGDSSYGKDPALYSLYLSGDTIITCGKDQSDLLLIATSAATGNVTWSKHFKNNVTGYLYDRPYSMTKTTDGNILVTGLQISSTGFSYGGFLMKINHSGNVLWNKLISPVDSLAASFLLYNVIENSDSEILISGKSYYPGGHGHLFKTDANGNLISSKTFNKPILFYYPGTSLYNYNLTKVSGNSFLIAGDNYLFQNDGQQNFGCDAFSYPVTVHNNTEFSTSMVSSAINTGTGYYQITGTATLTDVLITSGDYCSIIGMEENSFYPDINIFPNPATVELSIARFSFSEKAEINIYNTLGEKILSKEIAAGEKEVKLNVKNLPAGIYVVKVSAGEKMFVKKVVKQ